MRLFKKLILATLSTMTISLSGAANAAVISLNFEGINDSYPANGFAQIKEFYNGGTSEDGTSGTNFGVQFTDNALALCLNMPSVRCSNGSRGGLGDPTSAKGALFFIDGAETFMNVAAGFDTGFSFFYSTFTEGGSIRLFDGLNGTGALLARLVLSATPTGGCDPVYAANGCPFVATGIGFMGIAKSVAFAGAADQIAFDDVTFGSVTPGPPEVPLPAAFPLFAVGLGTMGFFRWCKERKPAA